MHQDRGLCMQHHREIMPRGNGSKNCRVPNDKGLIVPYVGNLLDALRSEPLSLGPSFGAIFKNSVAGSLCQILKLSCTILNDVRATIAAICLLDD
jgi:hypothetical protein